MRAECALDSSTGVQFARSALGWGSGGRGTLPPGNEQRSLNFSIPFREVTTLKSLIFCYILTGPRAAEVGSDALLRSQNAMFPIVASALMPASISYAKILSVVGVVVDHSTCSRSPMESRKSIAATMEAHPSGGARYASTAPDPSVLSAYVRFASESGRAAHAHTPRRRISARMVASVGRWVLYVEQIEGSKNDFVAVTRCGVHSYEFPK